MGQPQSRGDKVNVLIGCECSGIVREAFRRKGHQTYSCDLQPADDNSPYHFQCSIFDVINNGWDLMIAHPPCTYLTVAGARWFDDPRYPNRREDQQKALKFFVDLYNAPIKKIALENPVGVISTMFRKPDQSIQPYMFGHNAVKKTCLWLKNLPLLIEKYYEITNEADPYFINNAFLTIHNKAERSKLRSKTFTNIALAMADQWG